MFCFILLALDCVCFYFNGGTANQVLHWPIFQCLFLVYFFLKLCLMVPHVPQNFCLFVLNTGAIAKETTFTKELFDKAQSDGKIVIVSSWVKYCTSCAGQMKILNRAKKDGELSDIKFDNIEYFSFNVTNKEIANLLNVQYQTTLLIFKDNKEIYRSVGETTKDLIYKAIQSSI